MSSKGIVGLMRRLRLVWCVLAASTPAIELSAQTPPSQTQFSWAQITYLSGRSAYLEVGARNGVREGTRFDVIRRGLTIASLTAEFVSSTRTSCRIESEASPVAVGDSVRFIAVLPDTAVAKTSPRATRSRTPSAGSFRGRIGVRYLVLDPGAGATLTQPALDLRLDGQRMGGSPFGLTADIRAQRSNTSGSAGSNDNTTRIYQAALVMSPQRVPLRLTVGRQFAASLSSVGLFDGASMEFDRPRWSIGALGGYEPDQITLGFSNDTREYGAYVQLHNSPAHTPLWSLTLGGVGAYSLGEIDREFGFARLTFTSRRLSLFATQELDINREWKSVAESASTTPTASFVTAIVSLNDNLSLTAGMDKRRNVRLYRDYIDPEIAFDDSFREGQWGGILLNMAGHLRLSADARKSSGGSIGSTKSLTGSFGVYRLTSARLGMQIRATNFSGTTADGHLRSASVEISPVSMVRIEVSGGTRDSSRPLDATPATHIRWMGADADINIGRSVYLLLSSNREKGATGNTVYSFASLSYRF